MAEERRNNQISLSDQQTDLVERVNARCFFADTRQKENLKVATSPALSVCAFPFRFVTNDGCWDNPIAKEKECEYVLKEKVEQKTQDEQIPPEYKKQLNRLSY